MTSAESKWLKQVKKYPNTFNIEIESDVIYVINIKEDKVVFHFESSGNEFLFQLLNQLGYKSEMS
jgi:hypothetical protein